MHAQAGSFRHSPHQRNYRAFAIGAGNMHSWRQIMMRIAQLGEQLKGALKTKVNQFGMKGCKTIKRRCRPAFITTACA